MKYIYQNKGFKTAKDLSFYMVGKETNHFGGFLLRIIIVLIVCFFCTYQF